MTYSDPTLTTLGAQSRRPPQSGLIPTQPGRLATGSEAPSVRKVSLYPSADAAGKPAPVP